MRGFWSVELFKIKVQNKNNYEFILGDINFIRIKNTQKYRVFFI